MIYRTGETIEFWAFYVNSGSAATGLTVTATVYNSIGSVATPTVSEVGGGFYRCTYTPSADGAYVCVFTTAGTVDQADIAGIAFRGVAGVNNLDDAITSRPTASEIDSELTSSHGDGSWQAVNIEPLILTLSEDELNALLDGQSKKSIDVFKGDSLALDISVVDADGSVVDLTDATAKFTAREQENSSSAIIEKSLDIYDAANGKMRLTLTTSDTDITPKSYPADIEITFSDGRVKTIWKSNFDVKWDVGR